MVDNNLSPSHKVTAHFAAVVSSQQPPVHIFKCGFRQFFYLAFGQMWRTAVVGTTTVDTCVTFVPQTLADEVTSNAIASFNGACFSIVAVSGFEANTSAL